MSRSKGKSSERNCNGELGSDAEDSFPDPDHITPQYAMDQTVLKSLEKNVKSTSVKQ